MEAQRYCVTEEALLGLPAYAVILRSPIQRVLTNVFLAIQNPPIPIKAFSSKETATEWLLGLNLDVKIAS